MTEQMERKDAMPNRTQEGEPAAPSLYRATASAAHRLQRELLSADVHAVTRARATLSRLRRAVAQEPGEDPRAWWEVSEHVLGDLHDRERGRGEAPSTSEWAAFVAITLFSMHQQSSTMPMHVTGTGVGAAVGQLRRRTDSESIKPRLDAVMLATTPSGLRYHLRSLVGLLSAHGIGLDYGRLAEDLRRLRDPQRRRETVVRWGRDYASALRSSTTPAD